MKNIVTAAQDAGGRPAVGMRRASGLATPNQVLAIVCVGICLANLDLFIVNVAMPDIAKDFGQRDMQDLSWVLNGYAIVYAALLVFFGRLVERHRRDLSFLVGVGLFTLASAACAAAQGVWSLVAFRMLQAAGAALMTPTSLGLLLASFPPERRGSAVRTWTAIGGLAAAIGPVAGGLLLTVNWHWIFIVNVPIGLVAIWFGWRMLPHVEGHDAGRPDPGAALLVTGGIALLTLAIVKIDEWGWRSAGVLGAFAASLVLLAAFARHCRTSADPFVDPKLFGVRPFLGATLVMGPFSMAFGAMLLSVALWAQTAWGWSALRAGLAIAPGPLLVPLVSLTVAGRAIERFGHAAVITAGLLLFSAGIVAWALGLDATPSAWGVVRGMVLIGAGVGLTYPTLMGVAAGSLPPSWFSTGSGVINMVRQASLAIGVAAFVAIVGAPTTLTDRLHAFREGWWVMVAISLLGLVPTYAMIRKTRRA